MSAAAVLAESARRGVKLGVRAGKLTIDAPRGAIDGAFRDSLAEAKTELLAILDPSTERWGPSVAHDLPSLHARHRLTDPALAWDSAATA